MKHAGTVVAILAAGSGRRYDGNHPRGAGGGALDQLSQAMSHLGRP